MVARRPQALDCRAGGHKGRTYDARNRQTPSRPLQCCPCRLGPSHEKLWDSK